MQNYISEGKTVTVTAPRTVNSGDGVLVGSVFGIARFAAALNASLEILRIGLFDLAKDTTVASFNNGDKVYWDNTNFVATNVAAGNIEIGIALLANPDGTAAPGGQVADTTVRAVLMPSAMPLVTSADLDPAILQKKTVVLLAAQITTLHSVPVSLIPAPGAGKAIVVDAMLFQFKYGTVQFTGGGAVNPVYHGATTNLLGGAVAAATIQAAASAQISAGAPAAALGVTANAGVDLYAATADFAAGDGTAIVTIWYSVVTLG